jgi:PadR family transcriptional regulator, regulatory protein PadR
MWRMTEGFGLASSLRRGTLEFCVLALLRERPRYGVELAQQLGAAEALATTEGTLYPLLSRLRRSGWVATSWRESPAGPPRRYYSLTRAGRSALEHFRAEWVTFRDAVDRIVGTENR